MHAQCQSLRAPAFEHFLQIGQALEGGLIEAARHHCACARTTAPSLNDHAFKHFLQFGQAVADGLVGAGSEDPLQGLAGAGTFYNLIGNIG